eukprot:5249762-Alexandrium_andersonii.AAC.1
MLRSAGRSPATPGPPGLLEGRPDQPARPAGSAVRGQSVCLPVERTGNDPPIRNPAVYHQPG